MSRIQDGTGNGFWARVTREFMLRVYAQVESEISHVSENDGLAFSWSNVTYDYDAADTILLVKNTSPTRNLIIEDIVYGGDTATIVTIHLPTCDSPTGTAIVATNVKPKSGATAEATAIGDETTNAQANIYRNFFIGAAESKVYNTEGAVILGLNDCIAIDFVTNGAAAYCSITGYFHKVE